MHPEDIANGFLRRIVPIERAKKPADHSRTTTTIGELDATVSIETLASFMCDDCGRAIADGETAKAFTTWNTNRESEPQAWEKDYSA